MHLVESGRLIDDAGSIEQERGWLHRAMEWLVDLAGGAWMSSTRVKARRLKVIETLPLGAKKQLLLVSCDGESYLVGTGAESVQTITRVERRNVAAGPAIVVPVQGEVH